MCRTVSVEGVVGWIVVGDRPYGDPPPVRRVARQSAREHPTRLRARDCWRARRRVRAYCVEALEGDGADRQVARIRPSVEHLDDEGILVGPRWLDGDNGRGLTVVGEAARWIVALAGALLSRVPVRGEGESRLGQREVAREELDEAPHRLGGCVDPIAEGDDTLTSLREQACGQEAEAAAGY